MIHTDPNPHTLKTRALEQGFSLIELMIVIMIIGILGSVAIPAYKDYVVRAKVSEFFSIVQPAKLAVTEALMSRAATELNNTSLGLGDMASKVVHSISINEGIITIIGDSKALELPEGKTLTVMLTPHLNEGMISWSCSTTAAEFNKYLPSHCHFKVAAGNSGN